MYASESTNNQVHRYWDYGFSLSGNTITKVEIGIEFYCASNNNVKLRISWDGGNTWSEWSQGFTLTVEDIIYVDFTSVTSWTPDKLSNANLRVEIKYALGGGSGCFAPDTLITMADGSQKLIVDVKLRDEVLTKDGVGIVTAKTVHKSLNNYRLVQFKNVQMFPTHAVREGEEWHGLPPGLKLVFLKHIVNIETDKQSFFANGILVHNIEKGAWTAYLDWIPVRVTYSPAVTDKDFSDSGGGSEAFGIPFKALPVSDVGGGSESFGIPFKSLGFAEVGAGAESFAVPWRALGFSDVGGGADIFKLLRELGFSDSGSGADVFDKVLTALNKVFSDSGYGTDVFGTFYREMGFADTGQGSDVFAKIVTFLTKAFADAGSGADVFKLLREIAFSDSALGSDEFIKEVLGAIAKAFSDSGIGTDSFAKTITLLSKIFSDSGLGSDAFSIVLKTLGFSDIGSGLDTFFNPYRAMGFSDTGSGLDIFKLLRELDFLDSAFGTDVFAKTVLEEILKDFSDTCLAIDLFFKGVGKKVVLPCTLKGNSQSGRVKGYVD